MENLISETLERVKKIEISLTSTKNVLNIEELHLFTGLSKSHIYKLTCSGAIPHYKQSKHLFFDRAEVEEWLKSSKVKTQIEITREATLYNTKKRGGKL